MSRLVIKYDKLNPRFRTILQMISSNFLTKQKLLKHLHQEHIQFLLNVFNVSNKKEVLSQDGFHSKCYFKMFFAGILTSAKL